MIIEYEMIQVQGHRHWRPKKEICKATISITRSGIDIVSDNYSYAIGELIVNGLNSYEGLDLRRILSDIEDSNDE